MREAAPSDFDAEGRDASPAAATFEADASGGSTAAMGETKRYRSSAHAPYYVCMYGLFSSLLEEQRASTIGVTTPTLARLSEAANQAPHEPRLVHDCPSRLSPI